MKSTIIKLLVPLLALVGTAALLAGCGGSGESSTASGGSTDASGDGGGSIVYIGSENGAYVQVSCGAKEIAEKDGMKYSVQYAEAFEPSAQIPLVSAAIASHPDALLISPVDTHALIVPLKQAADEGIKVITVGNGIADNSFLTSAIAGNNYAVGSEAADYLGKKAAGKDVEVGYIGFTPGGSSITDAREEGFTDEIKKYPNVTLISPTDVNTVDANAGAAAASALISAHPNLWGIVGAFGPMSNGMAQAVRERGLAGKVVVVQLGAEPKAVENITAGTTDAIFDERFRDEGAKGAEEAAAALAGETVEKEVNLEPVEFNASNATEPSMQKYIAKNSC